MWAKTQDGQHSMRWDKQVRGLTLPNFKATGTNTVWHRHKNGTDKREKETRNNNHTDQRPKEQNRDPRIRLP